MINTQYGNYVKFIRGTEASWAKIDDSLKSSDTLYFISNTGSDSGKLYLGIDSGSTTLKIVLIDEVDEIRRVLTSYSKEKVLSNNYNSTLSKSDLLMNGKKPGALTPASVFSIKSK